MGSRWVEKPLQLPATGEPDEGAVDSSHFQAREVSSSQNSVQMWRDFRLVGILQRRCQTGPDWTAVSGRCCAWHFIDIAYSWWRFRFATQTGRAKKVTRARCRGAVFKRAPELIYYFFFLKGWQTKDLQETRTKCCATLLVRIRWWWKWKLMRRRTVKTVWIR